MKGWIKLHRKIRNSQIFNDMELFRLAMICLTEASHKEINQPIGNQVVNVQPGEFVTGRFDLHMMYNDGLKPKEKVSEKTVWRWLEKLEKLDFLTIKSTNKYSVVSLLNWDLYQGCDQDFDQQMTNKRTTDDQQMTTNKNVKNVKKKDNVQSDDYTAEFERFWNAYPRKKEKQKAFRLWKIKAKELSPDILLLCAKNYAKEVEGRDQSKIKLPGTFLGPDKHYEEYKQTTAEPKKATYEVDPEDIERAEIERWMNFGEH